MVESVPSVNYKKGGAGREQGLREENNATQLVSVRQIPLLPPLIV